MVYNINWFTFAVFEQILPVFILQILKKMTDKIPSPEESMSIISSMIQQTKHRVAPADIRVSVMWGIITIVTAIMVTILLLTMRDPVYNYGWFAIPVIGIPLNILIVRRSRTEKKVRTPIDRMSDRIWKIVGYTGLTLTAICVIFTLCDYKQAWLAMFYYAFIVVGLGASAQGAILQENSYIVGGVISVITGFCLIMATLIGVPLLVYWVMPLYIACFLLMFIVPAFIICRKYRKGMA